MEEVESLERATLAAIPPEQVLEFDGWLAALDGGTVGRAHSAVPTRHDLVDEASVPAILDAYAAHGRSPVFRVPRSRAFDPVRRRLATAGLGARQPTLTMTGAVAALAEAGADGTVSLSAQPDDDFAAAFLGDGFDRVDAASRLAILRRGRQTVFACARVDGRVVAVGTGCYAEGWCGIHGMRTVPAWRGRGLASAILAALGQEASRRGIARAFLQVEQANEAGRRLYRRAGLRPAWCYEYWRR